MDTQTLQPMERQIVQALGKHGPLTTEQLNRILRRGGRDCKAASVRCRVNLLARMGLVVRQRAGNGGFGGAPTLWALPAAEVQR